MNDNVEIKTSKTDKIKEWWNENRETIKSWMVPVVTVGTVAVTYYAIGKKVGGIAADYEYDKDISKTLIRLKEQNHEAYNAFLDVVFNAKRTEFVNAVEDLAKK